MTIEEQIAAGRALRTAPRPDPRSFFEAPTNPKTTQALLITLARAQLGRWIDAGVDYATIRTGLIADYIGAARSQFPRERDTSDYVAQHAGHYLGVFDRDERCPLPEGVRKELIRDTLARWLWLKKRQEYFGKHDPALASVSPQDCDVAAEDALEVEIQRRRRK